MDLKRRATSIALLERAAELNDEASELRAWAARHRKAAEEERDGAQAVAPVVEPEEPSRLHTEVDTNADAFLATLTTDRATGLKTAYKGVVDHQIALGQADRRKEDARARRRSTARRPAWQAAAIGVLLALLIGTSGYIVGQRDEPLPQAERIAQPATPEVTP
jgi:hypothetical protein